MLVAMGETPLSMGGIVDDANMGLALAEQRVKGIVIGVAVGAIGAGVLAYLFAPEALALLGAMPRKRNPSGCNSCGITDAMLGKKYKAGP